MWFWKKAKTASDPLAEEIARLDAVDAIEKECKTKKEEAMVAWRKHYDTLSPQLQSLVCLELAKRGASVGQSGFHGFGGNDRMPFSFCGWADYHDPGWGETQGVGFRINRACFGDRLPVLFYLDDGNWPWEERRERDLELVERYSSGIVRVRVEERLCKNWDGQEGRNRVVLFELDSAAVKKTVVLGGQERSTEEVGQYIFVLPRCGEFYCLLGEEQNGELIPLHRDDYCMK